MFLWSNAGPIVRQKDRRVYSGELRKLAKQYHVAAKRNGDIAIELRRRFSALRIWIAWKTFKKRQSIHIIDRSKESSLSEQDLDPITLEPPEKPYFDYYQSNGKITRYTAKVLIEYLNNSINLNEPTSNIPFSDKHLMELDNINVQNGWGFQSILERRYSNACQLEKERHEYISLLEAELIHLTRNAIENVQAPPILTLILLSYSGMLMELYRQDAAAAEVAIERHIDLIRDIMHPAHPYCITMVAIFQTIQTDLFEEF